MFFIRYRKAVSLLAVALFLPTVLATRPHAEEPPAMLENAPGMLLIEAVDAMHAGDLSKAEALFSLAIQQQKGLAGEGMAQAWFNRGLVRQRRGNLHAAIDDFTRALNSSFLGLGGRVEAYYNRGLAYRKLGRLQDAMNDFSRAIELYPRFAPAYYSRALGLAANGHYLLALVDMEKALRYGYHERHQAFYGKALIHLARGERTAAIGALRKALKLAPDFTAAKRRLASLQQRNGRRVTDIGLLPRENGGRLNVRHASLTGDVSEDVMEKAAPRKVAAIQPHPGTNGQSRSSTSSRRAARASATPPTKRIAARIMPSATPGSTVSTGNPSRNVEHALKTGIAVPAVPDASGRAASAVHTASVATMPRRAAVKASPNADKQAWKRISWALQLASMRREQDIRKRWQQVREHVTRHAPRARAVIMRTRVKNRGIYHRLRLMGFTSRSSAQAACRRLKENGISCLVVRVR